MGLLEMLPTPAELEHEDQARYEAEAPACPPDEYVTKGGRVWLQISCHCCAGIQWGGEYARECLDCDGAGQLWIAPSDHLAQYPGGRFLGSDPGRYRRAKHRRESNALIDAVLAGLVS